MYHIKNNLKHNNKLNRGYILLTTSAIILIISLMLSSLCLAFLFSSNLFKNMNKNDNALKEDSVLIEEKVMEYSYSNFFDIFYMMLEEGKVNSHQEEVEEGEETPEPTYTLELNLLKNIVYNYVFDKDEIDRIFSLEVDPAEEETVYNTIKEKYSRTVFPTDYTEEDAGKTDEILASKIISDTDRKTYNAQELFANLTSREGTSIKLVVDLNKADPENGISCGFISLASEENKVFSLKNIDNTAYFNNFKIVIDTESYTTTLDFFSILNFDEDISENKKEYPFNYMKNKFYEEPSEPFDPTEPGKEEEGETTLAEEPTDPENPGGEGEEEVKTYNNIINLTLDVTKEMVIKSEENIEVNS